jgi:FecR protein
MNACLGDSDFGADAGLCEPGENENACADYRRSRRSPAIKTIAFAVAFLLTILASHAGGVGDARLVQKIGDVVTDAKGFLQTKKGSRGEWEYSDGTIIRLGGSTTLHFAPATRDMILEGGVMFLAAQKIAGVVRVSAANTTVAGRNFMLMNVGQVKLISTQGRATIYLSSDPRIHKVSQGQMVTITAGDTVIPAATDIDLAVLLATSMLGEAGGLGPFPGQPPTGAMPSGGGASISTGLIAATAQQALTLRSVMEIRQQQVQAAQQALVAERAQRAADAIAAQQAVAAAAAQLEIKRQQADLLAARQEQARRELQRQQQLQQQQNQGNNGGGNPNNGQGNQGQGNNGQGNGQGNQGQGQGNGP